MSDINDEISRANSIPNGQMSGFGAAGYCTSPPTHVVKAEYRPSRLDYFAAKAMQGICSNPHEYAVSLSEEGIAKISLNQAHAMIAAIDAEAAQEKAK